MFLGVQRVVPFKGTTRWFKTKIHLCNYLKSKALQKRPFGLSF
ncbi:hypothetical protein BOVA172_574 [Bacteroides ovatus]|nr:hypothetical protein BOVA172_574 [Bacteroides ovatus]CAG9919038.1 hypothetical protein BOVA435_2864 [Bacteroides ovatus]